MFAYIQDADLWQWQLPGSKQFHAGLAEAGLEYDCNENPQIFHQLLQLTVASTIQRVSCWSIRNFMLRGAPLRVRAAPSSRWPTSPLQLRHQSLHSQSSLQMLSLSCQQLSSLTVLLKGVCCDIAGATGTGRAAEACGCRAGDGVSYCPWWP